MDIYSKNFVSSQLVASLHAFDHVKELCDGPLVQSEVFKVQNSCVRFDLAGNNGVCLSVQCNSIYRIQEVIH